MKADPLITTLIDLVREIDRSDFRLILGGGLGLYLKQVHLQEQVPLQTLMPGELWPRPRATEDIDIFLPTEFVVSLEEMQALRRAIDRLGFKPVEEVKFLHSVKPWDDVGRVKIDLLTGPLPDTISKATVKIARPRVRPRGDLELHAYLTEEAVDIESKLLALTIRGVESNATEGQVVVHIPQPFTFLLMKLHAFADRLGDESAYLGRHHALDVYRIIAMMTEEEYAGARKGIEKHSTSRPILGAREIVAKYFSAPTATGAIRIREHPLFTAKMDTVRLVEALADLFRSFD